MEFSNENVDLSDVADRSSSGPHFLLKEAGTSIFLGLCDRGRISQPLMALQVGGSGERTLLAASVGGHCLGVVRGAPLLDFLRTIQSQASHPRKRLRTAGVGLCDYDQAVRPSPIYSGMLVFVDGDSVSLEIGDHCFGKMKGPNVTEFFRRAWLRAGLESPGKRAA